MFSIHQMRARFGQGPFAESRKLLVKLAAEDESEHGIAQKLQPLVVLRHAGRFMRNGGMRQRQAQQVRIPETVAESFLKRAEMRHGRKSPTRASRSPLRHCWRRWMAPAS